MTPLAKSQTMTFPSCPAEKRTLASNGWGSSTNTSSSCPWKWRHSRMKKSIVSNTYPRIQHGNTSSCHINLWKCPAKTTLTIFFFGSSALHSFLSSCNFTFLSSMSSLSPSQVCPNTFTRILKISVHNIWYLGVLIFNRFPFFPAAYQLEI